MNDDTSTQAPAPAAEHTQPASAPAEHHQEQYEQPAATPEHYEEHFQDEPAVEPADLGEILEDRPKKLSGAQRAKLQRQYLENELSAREQRIAELERHIGERDANERQSEAERQAEAQRKREAAHLERVKGTKGSITDWDAAMASMRGATIHEDLIRPIDVPRERERPHLLQRLSFHQTKVAA